MSPDGCENRKIPAWVRIKLTRALAVRHAAGVRTISRQGSEVVLVEDVGIDGGRAAPCVGSHRVAVEQTGRTETDRRTRCRRRPTLSRFSPQTGTRRGADMPHSDGDDCGETSAEGRPPCPRISPSPRDIRAARTPRVSRSSSHRVRPQGNPDEKESRDTDGGCALVLRAGARAVSACLAR